MKYFIIAILGITLFFYGCGEDELLVPDEDVTIVNGILKFKNYDAFIKVVKLQLEADEEPEDLIRYDGFESAAHIINRFNELAEDDNTPTDLLQNYIESYPNAIYMAEDSSIEARMEEPILAALLDPKLNAVAIGDTLYQYTEQYLRRLPVTDEDLNNLSLLEHRLEQALPGDGIIVLDYIKLSEDEFGKSLCTSTCIEYKTGTSKYRMKAKARKRNYFLLKTIFLKTKSQKKRRFLGWSGKKTTYIFVQGSFSGRGVRSKTRRKKSKATVHLSWAFFNSSETDLASFRRGVNGTHRINDTNNGYVDCQTCKD